MHLRVTYTAVVHSMGVSEYCECVAVRIKDAGLGILVYDVCVCARVCVSVCKRDYNKICICIYQDTPLNRA